MVQAWCRVLVIEPEGELWGSQRYLLRLVGPMAERGVEHILATRRDSPLAAAWRADGHAAVALPSGGERSIRDGRGRLAPARLAREAGRTAANAWRISRLARGVGADVIHSNAHWAHLEVVLAGRLAGRPAVLHLHDQSRDDALGRLRAVAVARAAACVAVSQAVVASLPHRVRAKVQVVPNGVDTDEFAPGEPDPSVRAALTDDHDAPVILVMARLEPAKGIDHVIRAVADLPPALGHVRLAIAGTSVDAAYELRVRELGRRLLGPRIRFLGYRADSATVMRASEVLVLASAAEAMPLSILEAQSSGTVPVAYRVGGVPEIVEHDGTGLLAHPGDIADLSHQIGRLLTEPGLATRLSAAARAAVVAGGSLRHQADRYTAVLSGLLRR